MVGERCERSKIKIIVPVCSHPMRNRKFQKNYKKIQKIKKYHYEFISSQNRLEKDEKDRNKNFRFVSFRFIPTQRVTLNFKNIAKKFNI